MIATELEVEPEWPPADWQAFGERAVAAAFLETDFVALREAATAFEIAIRLTSDDEVHALNHGYRQKNAATNVLSFPMLSPKDVQELGETRLPEVLLGDIVLAHGVCAAEAAEKGVALADHVAHLIIHGTLHLLGYDHIDDEGANDMEGREARAMAALGLHDPYAES